MIEGTVQEPLVEQSDAPVDAAGIDVTRRVDMGERAAESAAGDQQFLRELHEIAARAERLGPPTVVEDWVKHPGTSSVYRTRKFSKLSLALSKAQGTIEAAAKDRENPFFKSRYADLASVWEACRESLNRENVAVFQPFEIDGTKVIVTTLLAFEDEWISASLPLDAGADSKMSRAQAIGVVMTYARRYGLSSMVGVAPSDDDVDGNTGEQEEQAGPTRAVAEAPMPVWQKVKAVTRVAADGDQPEFWKVEVDIPGRNIAYITYAADQAKLAESARAAGTLIQVTWTQATGRRGPIRKIDKIALQGKEVKA